MHQVYRGIPRLAENRLAERSFGRNATSDIRGKKNTKYWKNTAKLSQ
jgi:hypothetical protein